MNLLSEKQFQERKKNNCLVIYGSGSSINDLSKSQIIKLKDRDSLSFNWFCKHPNIVPDFFLIREQANISKRITKTETSEELFRLINDDKYVKTCFIVHDLSNHSPHVYQYHKNIHRIRGEGIILKDKKDGSFLDNPFINGIYHGRLTIVNALHIAGYLKYDEILFAGIDLYDSRYFWLKDYETRDSIRQKGLSRTARHPVYKKTISAIEEFRNSYPSVKLYCLNKESLLKKIMNHESI